MKSKRAQSIAEYALLITVVAASISAMSLYIKRTVQAGVRVTVDRQLVEEFGIIPLSGAATPGEQAQLLGMREQDTQETGVPIPVFSRIQTHTPPNSQTTMSLKNGVQTTTFEQNTATQGSSWSKGTFKDTSQE